MLDLTAGRETGRVLLSRYCGAGREGGREGGRVLLSRYCGAGRESCYPLLWPIAYFAVGSI